MKVAVSQTINCAHQLPGTEMHGHTYRVTVMLERPVGEDGMVVPFQWLQQRLTSALERIDHQLLENSVGQPATAERLAYYIKALMPSISKVRVEVGDDGWVETE